MAPRGFKQAGRGKRQIKGSIGGGGGKGNLTRKATGTGGGGGGGGGGGTDPGYVKDPTDPTLFRDLGGAFTTEGWVNVPGGRVYVLPGDTMSEAIGQGRGGLIPMANTERTRSAGGAYTQGGYVRTGRGGNQSVTRVRAGDTRSEVVGAARAATSRVTTKARAQSASVSTFRAGERTGVGVAAKSAAKPVTKAAPKATTKAAPVKKATVVPKGKAPAMRAK